MLTPIFELSQDDQFVRAIIHAPFANISETEIEFDGKEFLFSSKPYFLRLYLPDEVIENGEESANYDADTKKFTINIPKKESGKHFLGLDMITRLLTPPGKSSAKPKVEELSATASAQNDNQSDDDQEEEEEEEEDDETRWLANQIPPAQSTLISSNSNETHGYGFANQQHAVFSGLRDELSELIDIKSPDDISIADRRQLAFEIEREKFSEDHYLANLFSEDDADEIKRLTNLELFIVAKDDAEPIAFTMDERDRLKNLPKKVISIDQERTNVAMIGMTDLLFAYAYNYRTTEGEPNVESGWTITKLSSALSCLISWTDLNEALIASMRRSLCYPLYRNWDLSFAVLKDVASIFRQGRSMVLRCLLDIHRIFANDSDYRYIFNDLYITEYCVWIQGLDESMFEEFGKKIAEISKSIKKSDLSLNLDELEEHARSIMSGENQLDSDDDQEEHGNEHNNQSIDQTRDLMGKLSITRE